MKSRKSFLKTMIVLSLAPLGVYSCGTNSQQTSDQKIVGGTEVESSDIVTRSTVALVNSRGQSFCTGTLITRMHVLTAAHCLVNYGTRRLYVAFGPKATRGNFAIERLRVANFFKTHEEFSPEAMQSLFNREAPADIALVQLSEDAPSAFQPVRLLRATDRLERGETLLLAGFGITGSEERDSGTLRKVTVTLRSVLSSKKELIYGNTPGRSACRGDSGGPAFVNRGGQLGLVGVTSRGPRSCSTNGIYTDARQYRPWIATAIREGLAGLED